MGTPEPGSYARWGKRVLDIVGASVLLVGCAPVLLVAACIETAETRLPGLFRQERIGLNLQPFHVWKIRTMRVGGGSMVTTRDDPRVTRIGSLLRRLKIDELPQLINVLNGTMSLVGPRPTVWSDVELMTAEERRRFSVRPGLTGLAQIGGGTALDWPERIVLDLGYMEQLSLATDLRILWTTVRGAFRADFNTHPRGESEWPKDRLE